MLILPFEITQSSFPSDEYSGAAADDRSGFEDFQLAAFCCSFFSLFNFRVVEGRKKMLLLSDRTSHKARTTKETKVWTD